MNITVIMTAFNVTDTVRRSVESVMHQTRAPSSIVVVDDASEDGTQEKLLDLARQFSAIQLILNQTRRGIPYSLNQAAKHCGSGYIAFHSCADISKPERFAKQAKILDEESVIGAVGCWAEITYPRSVESSYIIRYPQMHEEITHRLRKTNALLDSTVMIRSELFATVGQYRKEFCCMCLRDLWLRTSEQWELRNLPEALYCKNAKPEEGVLRDARSCNAYRETVSFCAYQRRTGGEDSLGLIFGKTHLEQQRMKGVKRRLRRSSLLLWQAACLKDPSRSRYSFRFMRFVAIMLWPLHYPLMWRRG